MSTTQNSCFFLRLRYNVMKCICRVLLISWNELIWRGKKTLISFLLFLCAHACTWIMWWKFKYQCVVERKNLSFKFFMWKMLFKRIYKSKYDTIWAILFKAKGNNATCLWKWNMWCTTYEVCVCFLLYLSSNCFNYVNIIMRLYYKVIINIMEFF